VHEQHARAVSGGREVDVEDAVGVVGVPEDGVGEQVDHGANLDTVTRMTKWEYQVAPIPLHNETLMLNNFGEMGFELVHIEKNETGGLIAFLKRPKDA
jgi:hypothetical protein